MASYKLDIPDELVDVIKQLGYDVKSYFDLVFTKPLLEKFSSVRQNEAIKDLKPEIDKIAKGLKKKIKLVNEDDIQKQVFGGGAAGGYNAPSNGGNTGPNGGDFPIPSGS